MPSKLSCRKIRGSSPVTKPEAGTVSKLHKHDSRPARRAVANLRQERTLTVMRTKFMTKTLLLSATKHSMMPIAIMCDEEENLLFPTLVSDLYESYLVHQNLQNEMNSDVQNKSGATEPRCVRTRTLRALQQRTLLRRLRSTLETLQDRTTQRTHCFVNCTNSTPRALCFMCRAKLMGAVYGVAQTHRDAIHSTPTCEQRCWLSGSGCRSVTLFHFWLS